MFRRRLKALRALREHTELLAMMTDPRRRILDSEEVAVEDDDFSALDEASIPYRQGAPTIARQLGEP